MLSWRTEQEVARQTQGKVIVLTTMGISTKCGVCSCWRLGFAIATVAVNTLTSSSPIHGQDLGPTKSTDSGNHSADKAEEADDL